MPQKLESAVGGTGSPLPASLDKAKQRLFVTQHTAFFIWPNALVSSS